MRAVYLTEPGQFNTVDITLPEITRPNEVLLHIRAVGVCGSDLHYYRCGRIGDQIVEYPWIIGHECVALVTEVGESVSRVQKGDIVTVDPLVVCGRCDQCMSGRQHTCRNQAFLGCPGQMQGCMCEYLVLPEENCFSIDTSLSLGVAVMIEPLAIGIYAVSALADPLGARVAILGTGPIGLSVLLAAKKSGVERIYSTELREYRAEAARNLGTQWSGIVKQNDVVAEIAAAEPDGLDAVFECSGEPEVIAQAIEMLKPGGTLLIVGIPEVDIIQFNVHQLRRKEITIRNIRRQNDCVPAAIQLATENAVALECLVTHNFEISDSKRAFETVAGYRDDVIKALIHF
jgi:L-iditol 2-dehydrogenase